MKVVRIIIRLLIILFLIVYLYYFMDVMWFQRDYITEVSMPFNFFSLLAISTIPFITLQGILIFTEICNRKFFSESLFWSATPFPVISSAYVMIFIFQLPNWGIAEILIPLSMCVVVLSLHYNDYKNLKNATPRLSQDSDILDM